MTRPLFTRQERIKRARNLHYLQLQAIFPITLPKSRLFQHLARFERRANALGLRLCNGPELPPGHDDMIEQSILDDLDNVLHFRQARVPVFLNRDPRGYGLKIEDEWMRAHYPKLDLHRDMGGYGIIYPSEDMQ